MAGLWWLLVAGATKKAVLVRHCCYLLVFLLSLLWLFSLAGSSLASQQTIGNAKVPSIQNAYGEVSTDSFKIEWHLLLSSAQGKHQPYTTLQLAMEQSVLILTMQPAKPLLLSGWLELLLSSNYC